MHPSKSLLQKAMRCLSPWDARDPGAGKAASPGLHPTREHQVDSSIQQTPEQGVPACFSH